MWMSRDSCYSIFVSDLCIFLRHSHYSLNPSLLFGTRCSSLIIYSLPQHWNQLFLPRALFPFSEEEYLETNIWALVGSLLPGWLALLLPPQNGYVYIYIHAFIPMFIFVFCIYFFVLKAMSSQPISPILR